MSLSGKFGLSLIATDDNTVELSRLVDYLNLNRDVNFAEGEGANQMDMVFHDTRTLADGANETLDFHDGSLTNKVGISITMDKLKALYVKNTSVDAGLLVGGAAANQMGLFADVSDKIDLPPGGIFIFIAPDVTGLDISVNADLKLEHDGVGVSSLDYELIAFGVDVA